MVWRHTLSPKSKKVRVQRSAGKDMLTFFWDYNGPILEHYMLREALWPVPPTQSWGKIWSQLFGRNGTGCWRRGCVSSTKIPSHILLQQHCRLFRSCGLRAYHTFRTDPTSRSRIFTSSIHWRMRWVERGSGTTTRIGRTHWIENLSKACVGVGTKFSNIIRFITNGTQARALTKIRINMHICKNVNTNY